MTDHTDRLNEFWLKRLSHAEGLLYLRSGGSRRLTASFHWIKAQVSFFNRRDVYGRLVPSVKPSELLNLLFQSNPPPMYKDARDLWRASEIIN